MLTLADLLAEPTLYGLLTSLVVYVGVSLVPARNEARVAGVAA